MWYLLSYSVLMISLVLLREAREESSSERFLVANRSLAGASGAMSIAASWIWAPALFISTQVGYTWGYSALCWFVLPNMLSLILFVRLARPLRAKYPKGFSFIEHSRQFGRGFWLSQLSVQLLMQVLIFALQLTAGAELLSFISGASYELVILTMLLTALCYSLLGGLHSSIFTDTIQYTLILFAIAGIYFAVPSAHLEVQTELRAFEPFNWELMRDFGIPSAVGLLFAIFADHQQWQRLFATREGATTKTFYTASILHGIVTFSLGSLGVLAACSGYEASNVQLVGSEYISAELPQFASIVFVFMALCGLCSTLDSCLCAFSSLYSTELSKNKSKVQASRRAMLLIAALGLLVSLLRVPLISLWFLASTLRLAAFAPTAASIIGRNYSGKNGTLAICIGLLFGGGVFLLGIYQQDAWTRTLGMLISLGLSSAIVLLPYLSKTPKTLKSLSQEA